MGTKPEEDQHESIDAIQRTLRVMHATKIEAAELASYCLKEMAYSWYNMWEESHEEDYPSTKWDEFDDAFMDHFFSTKMLVKRAMKFEI